MIGQRFSWIPAAWYGPCKLTTKTKHTMCTGIDTRNSPCIKFLYKDIYDLKFDAAVVNPPGVIYGVDGDLRVRLLK